MTRAGSFRECLERELEPGRDAASDATGAGHEARKRKKSECLWPIAVSRAIIVAKADRSALPRKGRSPDRPGSVSGEGEGDDVGPEEHGGRRCGSFHVGRRHSVVRAAQAQIAYVPEIGFVPTGATMTVTPVVSADRRYVRLSVNAFFNNLNGVHQFSFPGGAVSWRWLRWLRWGRRR